MLIFGAVSKAAPDYLTGVALQQDLSYLQRIFRPRCRRTWLWGWAVHAFVVDCSRLLIQLVVSSSEYQGQGESETSASPSAGSRMFLNILAETWKTFFWARLMMEIGSSVAYHRFGFIMHCLIS